MLTSNNGKYMLIKCPQLVVQAKRIDILIKLILLLLFMQRDTSWILETG